MKNKTYYFSNLDPAFIFYKDVVVPEKLTCVIKYMNIALYKDYNATIITKHFKNGIENFSKASVLDFNLPDDIKSDDDKISYIKNRNFW